jgi:hypothetical protein
MKNSLLTCLLAAGCLLSGCEKEVTGIKLPASDSKLLVTSFISPQDTAVFAHVSRSEPSLGYQRPLGEPVTNASVSISDGTQTRQLTYTGFNAGYHVNTRDFPIVAGVTYTLRASVPGGETVEATCTVPAALAEAPVVTVDSVLRANDAGRDYFVRLNWTDAGGQENYYRPLAETQWEYLEPPNNKPGIATSSVNWQGEVYLDDRGKDGERLFSPRGQLWIGSPPSNVNAPNYLNAHVLHTDRHYYQYHRSLQLASRSDGNPFAEPVLVYSNVTGGLGVFAAYNRTTVMTRVR